MPGEPCTPRSWQPRFPLAFRTWCSSQVTRQAVCVLSGAQAPGTPQAAWQEDCPLADGQGEAKDRGAKAIPALQGEGDTGDQGDQLNA